jgi:hypothetical protein
LFESRIIAAAISVAAVTFLQGPASAATSRLSDQVTATAVELLDNSRPAFIKSVRAELNQSHFAALDAMAQDLWRTKARFPGGAWKLAAFYEALGDPSDHGTASEEDWKKHLLLLRVWKVQHTPSAAPAIGLAVAWRNYAWVARGSGFSASVTDEGHKLFKERLKLAEKALMDVRSIASNNPHWHTALLAVALGQGWSRPGVEALFDEGVALEPLYTPLYTRMATYLLPRWYGEDGDWERFADEATRRVGGRQGSALYSYVAVHVSELYDGDTFFKENSVSWPRIRQAFVDREALYGASVDSLNTYALMAGNANDQRTSRALFVRIGEAWDAKVWEDRKWFDKYRVWAMRECRPCTQ